MSFSACNSLKRHIEALSMLSSYHAELVIPSPNSGVHFQSCEIMYGSETIGEMLQASRLRHCLLMHAVETQCRSIIFKKFSTTASLNVSASDVSIIAPPHFTHDKL